MVALNQSRPSVHAAPETSERNRENPQYHGRIGATFSQSSHRARYYDPSTAEFTSRDPLEYVDGMSAYRGYFVNIGLDATGTKLVIVIPLEGPERRVFYNLVVEMLKSICPKVVVEQRERGDDDVTVTIDDSLEDGEKKEGCCCLKELIENEYDNFMVLRDHREIFTESRNDEDGHRVRGTDGNWVAGNPVAATVFLLLEFEYFEIHEGERVMIPYFVVLAHELCGHVLYYNRGLHRKDQRDDDSRDIPNAEVDAVDEENKIRDEHGLPKRTRY